MSETTPKVYPFDAPFTIVSLIAKPAQPADPEKNKPARDAVVTLHKLRRPTDEEIFEWEKGHAAYEQKELSDREMQVLTDNETANIKLWRKVIMEVKGYNFNLDGQTDWRPVNDTLIDQMPVGHRSAAIRAMYNYEIEVRDDDSEGFVLGKPEWFIDQWIGGRESGYLVTHVFREPTEQESRDFRRGHASTIKIGGSKKDHTKVTTHIRSHMKLYDALVLRIESGGREVGKQMVDPISKQRVVSVFVNNLEAETQD